VVVVDFLGLAVPNAISPNSDGLNDAFVVPGIDYYPDSKFILFNSWGQIEYESNDYRNDFKGENKSGQTLLDGTFYYTLFAAPKLNYSGYIIIKK
jgi:gliding motility-associated-like protein